MLVGCEEERWFHPRQFVFPDRIHELRTIARYSSDFLNIEGEIVEQDAHAGSGLSAHDSWRMVANSNLD